MSHAMIWTRFVHECSQGLEEFNYSAYDRIFANARRTIGKLGICTTRVDMDHANPLNTHATGRQDLVLFRCAVYIEPCVANLACAV